MFKINPPPTGSALSISKGLPSVEWALFFQNLWTKLFANGSFLSGPSRSFNNNRTLTVDDSGFVIRSTKTGALTYTMPAAADGLIFLFLGNSYANVLTGGTFQKAGGATSSSFTMSASMGQLVLAVCDGSTWYLFDNINGSSFGTTTNGYIRLPDSLGGVILQWGTVPSVGTGASIVFPLTFPIACFAFAGTLVAGASTYYAETITAGPTTSGVSIGSTVSYAVPYRWIAIGV